MTIEFTRFYSNCNKKINSELESSLNNYLQCHPQITSEKFARYCLDEMKFELQQFWLCQQLKNKCLIPETMMEISILRLLTSLAIKHLSCLLQDCAVKASHKIYQKFQHQLSLYQSQEEIVNFGLQEALNPVHFFRNFKPEKHSLICYAHIKMSNRIKDNIFTGKKRPLSNYGYLRELKSEKKKKNALQRLGYWGDQQAIYILAWSCFNQVYRPNKTELNQQDWEAIAYQYNQLKPDSYPIISWSKIKYYIEKICLKSAQNFLSLSTSSLTDSILEIPSNSPIPEEVLEEKEMKKMINNFLQQFGLNTWLSNLNSDRNKMMFFRYGLNLTQQEVVKELWQKSDNTKVSREEDRIVKELMIDISKWMDEYLPKIQINNQWEKLDPKISITLEWVKNQEIKPLLEPKFKQYYQSLILTWLHIAYQANHPLKSAIIQRIETDFQHIIISEGMIEQKIDIILEKYSFTLVGEGEYSGSTNYEVQPLGLRNLVSQKLPGFWPTP